MSHALTDAKSQIVINTKLPVYEIVTFNSGIKSPFISWVSCPYCECTCAWGGKGTVGKYWICPNCEEEWIVEYESENMNKLPKIRRCKPEEWHSQGR